MNRALAFWLAVLLCFCGGMMIFSVSRSRHATNVGQHAASPVAPLSRPKMESFELLDQTGARFNSTSMKGKVWLGSFFFTACPAKCYQQNMKIQQLYAKYVNDGLHAVSISCDPDNDTAVVLAGYAARFNANPNTWKFLTSPSSDRKYLQQVGNEYMGISVDATTVTHSDRVVLFDQDGKIRGSYQVLVPRDFKALETELEKIFVTSVESGDSPATDSPAGEST